MNNPVIDPKEYFDIIKSKKQNITKIAVKPLALATGCKALGCYSLLMSSYNTLS